MTTPWSSNDTDADEPESGEWSEDLFTPEARLFLLPAGNAKLAGCPVCEGKGWILEVPEP